MCGNEWSRRDFLKHAGRATGTLLVGSQLGSLEGLLIPSDARAGMVAPMTKPLGMEELAAVLADLVGGLEKKALYASAFYAEGSGLNAFANRGEKGVQPRPKTSGVVFQVYDGHRFQESSTDLVDADSLHQIAKELKRDISRPPRGASKLDAGPSLHVARTSPRLEDPDRVSLAQWRSRAESLLEDLHASDSRIRSAQTRIGSNRRRTLFVNRNRQIQQDLVRGSMMMFAFAADQSGQGRAFTMDQRLAGFEITQVAPSKFDEFAEMLQDDMVAERIEPGTYDVISDPSVTGLLAHESFGHGVEYDQFIKGRAKAAHFLGKRVAPDHVNIWDDPSNYEANGSYYFDDEGWEAKPTQIVKDGIFVQPLTDFYSSHAGGMRRTANGRREQYSNKAYARMSNTFFGRGETPVSEMVAAVDKGIHITGFMNGIEDPHGWGIQFTASRGYEIKNGRRTGRVFSPVSVTGYVPDILDSITHVSNEFALNSGTCGKGYKEYVPVGAGGPHLKFRAPLS